MGAKELEQDIRKLGYYEVLLRCASEPALNNLRQEVRRLRKELAVLENSGVGDIRANGAAEQSAQTLGEQVRILLVRRALGGVGVPLQLLEEDQ